MRGASATRANKFLAQRSTCAVSADGGVAGCDVVLACKGIERLLMDIDFAQQRGVTRIEAIDHLVYTCADGVVQLRFVGGLMFQLLSPALERGAFRGTASMCVDDGVPQNPIKPCDGGFISAQFALVLQGAHVGGLQYIFGEFAIQNALLYKAEEFPALIEKFGYG